MAPGSKASAEEVGRSQRERLFGATVALVSEKGYAATTIGELVALSGVSRSSFYRNFDDKPACFVATMEASLALLAEVASLRYDGRGSALRTVLEAIAAQPAAARICLLEAHPAGPRAAELIERAAAGMEALYVRAYTARGEAESMPPELVGAVVGALRRVVSVALLHEKTDELAGRAEELWEWSMSYPAPARPLRRRSRVHPSGDRGLGGEDAGERIIAGAEAAYAANGYLATTIAEIVAQAGVSLRTFYKNFSGKEAVFWAALDAGQAQMFAQALPAYRRALANGWPQAIRAGCEAIFDFLAANPNFARLAFVETQSFGRRGLALREQTAEALRAYIEVGYGLRPQAAPIARLAIPGAVTALIHRQIESQGPQRLSGVAPLATYLVLAPFLGPEEACAVARGER